MYIKITIIYIREISLEIFNCLDTIKPVPVFTYNTKKNGC